MREIHFHIPALRRYSTSEYQAPEHLRFVSVSVTGMACALACDHCQGKILHGMIPLPQHQEGLFALCRRLAQQGVKGILVSGGCDRRGRVPLRPYLADLRRVKEELGLVVRVHTGLVDEETASGLGEVGVDGAMMDVLGAEETIRQVYHLDAEVTDYERTLERLARHRVPLIPHILLGLHYGRLLGEYRALEMVAQFPLKLLVLIILMPLYGTPMAGVTPPSPEEVGSFFRHARARLPHTPIMLGCARPMGPIKEVYDRLAVDAGLDGIAYPAEGIVAYARAKGLVPRFHDACCGVFW